MVNKRQITGTFSPGIKKDNCNFGLQVMIGVNTMWSNIKDSQIVVSKMSNRVNRRLLDMSE